MKSRKLKISSQPKPNKTAIYVPAIRLSGEWLSQAGFCISDYISIEVEEGKLVISKSTEVNHVSV